MPRYRSSNAFASILPHKGIDTSFLTERAEEVFDGGIHLFDTPLVTLRGMLSEVPGSTEIVVFPVGLGEFGEKWAEEAARLKAQGKAALMIEPRGIGLSTNTALPGSMNVSEGSEDLWEVFGSQQFSDIVGDRKAVLCGHSTGANMAMKYALSRTDSYNRIFSGMVLKSPAFALHESVPVAAVHVLNAAKTATLNTVSFAPLLGMFAKEDLAKNPLTNDLEQLAAARALQTRGFKRLLLGHTRAKGTVGFASELDRAGDGILWRAASHRSRPASLQIKGPITFICGADDTLISLKRVQQIGQKLGATVHIIPGARHEQHIDSGPVRDAFHQHFDDGLARALAPR